MINVAVFTSLLMALLVGSLQHDSFEANITVDDLEDLRAQISGPEDSEDDSMVNSILTEDGDIN